MSTMFGLFMGVGVAALLPSPSPYRVSLLAAVIALIGMMASGESQFFFWFGAIPSMGALAATLPLRGAREQ